MEGCLLKDHLYLEMKVFFYTAENLISCFKIR